ncbi:GNAT family N-acetyltransferase [Jannaschia sp. CCS1]|uniref:GNAT family N-acetyltransferase n=1 Tax=Jannaschia sp. (strain CCS1) TaxID=290400 RepID=UPI000053AFED|nr:GNAT family N-acetyltransferase [Jannaschia sp. CCS1]ABD53240.1 GCN5-related N-acetyltransferase [Jannaschia sp. CCS1]
MKVRLAVSEAERQACFDIRRAVFIEEQQIPEAEEWDAHDATCLHYLAGDGAGTARVIAKGDTAKIGRVAVTQAHRGTGLGAKIMQALMADARIRGFKTAELEAQVYAIPFYARLGFIAEGPEYDDGSGILHRLMRADL